jgi:hypothetical protein
MAPRSIVEVDRHFRGIYGLYHQGDDGIRTSETSVYFYEISRRYISEGFRLHARRHDSLKSHLGDIIFSALRRSSELYFVLNISHVRFSVGGQGTQNICLGYF